MMYACLEFEVSFSEIPGGMSFTAQWRRSDHQVRSARPVWNRVLQYCTGIVTQSAILVVSSNLWTHTDTHKPTCKCTTAHIHRHSHTLKTP